MIAYMFRSFLQYLRAPVTRSADDFADAIEEEIAFHVAQRTQEHLAQGMPEPDARSAALTQFGDPSRVAAECHAAAIGVPLVWHRLHLSLTCLLLILSGFVAVSWWTSQQPKPVALPPGIASILRHDWTGDIRGQALDEQGHPLRDAQILVVVKAWPDQSYFQRAYYAKTKSDGRFLIQDVYPIDEPYEVQLAAVAPDRVLKSSYYNRSVGALDPVVLSLPPSSAFAVQIESEQGTKLPDIEVLPRGRIEPDGTLHSVYFDSAQPLLKRTDREGRVDLSHFQPGDTASVLVRVANGEWQSREILVPDEGRVVAIRVSARSS